LNACILHKNRALAVAEIQPDRKNRRCSDASASGRFFGAIRGDGLEATPPRIDSIAPTAVVRRVGELQPEAL